MHVFFRFFLRCGEVVVPSDSTFDEASCWRRACGQHFRPSLFASEYQGVQDGSLSSGSVNLCTLAEQMLMCVP